MRISLIVAMDLCRVIGRDGDLPWHLPADLKHFKETTMGKPIIMGRKTWDSIGRALPGRTSIVLTRSETFQAEGATVVTSAESALSACQEADEAMIIGGGDVFSMFLPMAQRIYLTRIHEEFEGDTWFPQLDIRDWHEVSSDAHEADAENLIDYTFAVLERRA